MRREISLVVLLATAALLPHTVNGLTRAQRIQMLEKKQNKKRKGYKEKYKKTIVADEPTNVEENKEEKKAIKPEKKGWFSNLISKFWRKK